MGTAEEDLEEIIEGHKTKDNGDKQESIGVLIDKVSEFISEMDPGEITFLTPENVVGLEEAKVYQSHLEALFGWRINAIDVLIVHKLIYTKSVNGRLIDKKIEALRTLQAQINANLQPDIVDRALGITREKMM